MLWHLPHSSLRLLDFIGLASQWVSGIFLFWIIWVLGLGQTLLLEAGDPSSGHGVYKVLCTDVADPLFTELFPQQQRFLSSGVLTSICCWFLIKENCVLWTFTIQYVGKCFGSAVWKHLKNFKNPKPSNLIKSRYSGQKSATLGTFNIAIGNCILLRVWRMLAVLGKD